MPGTSLNDLWISYLEAAIAGTLPVIGSGTAGTAQTQAADITVDATAGGVTLLAANTDRKYVLIQNTGAQPIRVGIGTTPTATTGIQLAGGDSLELKAPYIPTVIIKAIREGGTNSTATVFEVE